MSQWALWGIVGARTCGPLCPCRLGGDAPAARGVRRQVHLLLAMPLNSMDKSARTPSSPWIARMPTPPTTLRQTRVEFEDRGAVATESARREA